MQAIITIEEFALKCASLTSDEIYEFFEFGISEDLRDTIYQIAHEDCPEPCRDALNKLGTFYNIQSLINY